MINGIYLSTMGALVEGGQHGLIANNLANANTVGYKPKVATFRELLSESMLQPGYRPEVHEVLEKTGGGVWMNETTPVFEPGPVRETGNPLQAAILQPNGFFRVSRNGEQYLTRDGAFQIDEQGRLTLSDGETLVLDDGGAPLLLGPDAANVQIGADGALLDGTTGQEVARLGLTRVDDLEAIRAVGKNLYDPQEAQLQPGGVRIAGGHVEDSAVSPVREMTAMIEAARTYQANMKFISIQDETLGRTVNTVGSVR
jgi:flagellar basal body rod protein FlgG